MRYMSSRYYTTSRSWSVWLWNFFFNDTATPEIYTLSLHDALPISHLRVRPNLLSRANRGGHIGPPLQLDRKSTRLNSSHLGISYAVFCLKKKNGRHTYLEYTSSTGRPQPCSTSCA